MTNKIEYKIDKSTLNEVGKLIDKWETEKLGERIWKKDPTIWRKDPSQQAELADRLGWLDLAYKMEPAIGGLKKFADEIKSEYDDVVLLGMGGSSLAPEVFFKTYGSADGFPRLTILDSTHPDSVLNIIHKLNLERTIFIVASKSGGTVETMSFFYTFFDEVQKFSRTPGNYFIAITDPGSGLEKLARENNFRKTFSTPADVGGRYSALTFFGMVPAALIGMDLNSFIGNAKNITDACSSEISSNSNPGIFLGALIGKLAIAVKDKLTFFASPKISSFAVWVEQLIAESTGKDNKGILPIADEDYSENDIYGSDRVFVFLRLEGDNNKLIDEAYKHLTEKNFSIIKIDLENVYQLAQEFYRWEFATAISGAALDIHPFDQPNVQLAKTMANESLNQFKNTGSLTKSEANFSESVFSFFGDIKANNGSEFISSFLNNISAGNYIAINAFIPMTTESESLLQNFRFKIRDTYKVATTLGFGPRFLHSTGQFHKGGTNSGYFIQITSDIDEDLEVKGQGYSYGVLVNAQALGDLKAFQSKNRKVIRINITGNIEDGLKKLVEL